VGPLLRYEELGSAATRQTLEDYLGWPVPALDSMIRITGEAPGKAERLRWIDRALLRRGTGTTAEEFGYG
jgi:hypothetical protein